MAWFRIFFPLEQGDEVAAGGLGSWTAPGNQPLLLLNRKQSALSFVVFIFIYLFGTNFFDRYDDESCCIDMYWSCMSLSQLLHGCFCAISMEAYKIKQ